MKWMGVVAKSVFYSHLFFWGGWEGSTDFKLQTCRLRKQNQLRNLSI